MPPLIQAEEDTEIGRTKADTTHRRDQIMKLTALLPGIATDVTSKMETAGIYIPIFFTIPSSGNTVVNFITPDDKTTDENWATACGIVCRILEDKIGFKKLIAREVLCIGAGAQSRTNDSAADSP